MVDFEWDSEQIPGYKLGLHILQILFAFTAWCLEIAVFRADDSKVNGRNGWTFAVVRGSSSSGYCPRFNDG